MCSLLCCEVLRVQSPPRFPELAVAFADQPRKTSTRIASVAPSQAARHFPPDASLLGADISPRYTTIYRFGQKSKLFHCKLQLRQLWTNLKKFKEIPQLESLLNFQKAACNICHIPSTCYHFTLQNGKQCKAHVEFCKYVKQLQSKYYSVDWYIVHICTWLKFISN